MTPQQLKNSILQLAIQGKLVPQDPNDEPASVLIERIREEKARLVREKKIKKDKNSSFIYRGSDKGFYEVRNGAAPVCIDDQLPFDIPDSWTWARLGEVCEVKGGKRLPLGMTYSTIPTRHVYIRVSDMKNASIQLHDNAYIDEKVYDKIKKYTISSNDLYLTIAGSIGIAGIVPCQMDGMNLTENAAKLTNIFIDKYFLLHLILSDYTQNQFKDKTNKVAQPKLALTRIESVVLPIPPIQEQWRIVDKVEKAESLIEEYTISWNKVHALDGGLMASLRKSLLQEAIQGRLVPQLPEEGTAQDLLAQIQEEKERLVREGKLKPAALAAPAIERRGNSYYENGRCIDSEIPFDIPDSWAWVRLGTCGVFTRGNGIKKDQITKDGKPCVRYGQLYTTYKTRFTESISRIPKELFEQCQKAYCGDILMSLTGENKFDIALAVLYEGEEDLAFGGDMTKFTSFLVVR